MVRFVLEFPAMMHKKTLFIADLHLGIEREFWKEGIRISGVADRILKDLEALFEKTKPKRIIVNGDFKHNIPFSTFREERDVLKVYHFLETQGEVLIIKGNHDGDLEKILPGANIFPSSGILEGKIYVFHGNAWPSFDFPRARCAITAHTHPAVEIPHEFGKELVKCFLAAEIGGEIMEERFGEKKEMLIFFLPAFSPVITGTNVFESIIGVFGNFIVNKRVFLLDGTPL